MSRLEATLHIRESVLSRQQRDDLIQDLLQCRAQVNQPTSEQLAQQISKQVALTGDAANVNSYWPVGAVVQHDIQPEQGQI